MQKDKEVKLTTGQRDIIKRMREGANLYRYYDVWEMDSEIVSKAECLPLVDMGIIEHIDWKVTYLLFALTTAGKTIKL